MDGVDNHAHFFEGTEKLLEVWFAERDGEHADLRRIQRSEWEGLLTLVKCDIVSQKSDGDMDAYVLSESSMFVTRRRFILKTCGRTALLNAVNPLLTLVKEKCGFTHVEDIFYSRKNFQQPHQQEHVYQKFEDEVEHLDILFQGGMAYRLGQINNDCWYLYTLEDSGVNLPDQTIELLMWGLDPSCMRYFFKDTCQTGWEASVKSGIVDLVPEAVIDDYMFEPCGYSMNGIIPGGHYMTIHVTPEEGFSYVSFESNIPKTSYNDLIHRVIDIFKPTNFLVTIFANEESIALKYASTVIDVRGYKRKELQCCLLKNYTLNYCQFSKEPIK